MKMSTSGYVVIMPDGHIYVSRCGVRKSYKESLTMTNYLKYLPFFFYVFLLTDTNFIRSLQNAGPICRTPDVVIVEDVDGNRPQQTP
jgi:hypothetical protein